MEYFDQVWLKQGTKNANVTIDFGYIYEFVCVHMFLANSSYMTAWYWQWISYNTKNKSG